MKSLSHTTKNLVVINFGFSGYIGLRDKAPTLEDQWKRTWKSQVENGCRSTYMSYSLTS